MSLDLGQQLVEDGQLAAVLDQVLVGRVRRTWLNSIKEVRVVGALAQLHQDVLKTHLLHLSGSVDDVDILHQDLGVEVALHLGQADVQVQFLLGEKRFFDVGFQTSEEEGFKNAVKTLNEVVVAEAAVGVEPLVEVFRAFKNVGKKEVQKRPELVEVVLQRRSSEQKTVGRFDLSNDERQFRLLVLDTVGLVDDHVLPVELLENALLSDQHFVRGHDNVPPTGHHCVSDELITSFLKKQKT